MLDVLDKIMAMMITKPQYQYQRQSSDESCSSNTSPSKSKTHRRTSSFISSDELSTNAAMDPLNMTWSSSGSANLSRVPMIDCCLPSSKSERKFLGHQEQDESLMRTLELIRELSFCSPPLPHKTKKRADTAETEETSSFSSTSNEISGRPECPEEEAKDNRKHDESPIGFVNLKQLHDLRRASPSPLVGLQYLPDGYSYI
mmetsp:Transcript_8883/g.14560  ORF Transcript_8883/g.14560 Transcript_8883/m.14560 type:complete len:201 (+) Transcript_8883:263-865(+)